MPQPLSPGMKFVFALGCVLVTAAGVQLYVLTEETDRWFAWTISVPLTAACLGAFYWTALAVAFQSYRKHAWAEARVGVLGVFVFVSLTFLLTVIHADKFHFDSHRSTAQGAAYVWFVIYLIDPLLIGVAWFFQNRLAGTDPRPSSSLPLWYRLVLLFQGAFFTFIGALLFVLPSSMADFWPWALTPLTARAVGAWIIGVGMVEISAYREDAWERIDVATVSFALLGALQFIALLRYRDLVHWGAIETWIYLLGVASVFIVGSIGAVATISRRGSRTAKSSVVVTP